MADDSVEAQNRHGYGADFKAEGPAENMVLYEKIERHIAKVTLNRPEKGNAILPPDTSDELARKMEMAGDDDEVKVVILAGAGRHFCSGEDVRRMPVESYGLRKGQKLPQSVRMRGAAKSVEESLRTILFGAKTTIAAVQGAALGAGTG